MASQPNGGFEGQIRLLWDGGTVAGLSDGTLLERFASRDGGPGELAFEALVRRHGPMVMRTCRGILGDRHAAEDAFQATFLVLARKAPGLRPRVTLGPWLHATAIRVSLCTRSASNRRRRKERDAAENAPSVYTERAWDDGEAIVHEEIGRLPERFRAAVVMCDLEGLTTDEAASQLGWPVGTVRSRLSRGRGRLRIRLTRRGLGPEAGAIAPAGSPSESPLLPLVQQTAGLAMDVGLNGSVPASASLATLMKGALFAMTLTKLKYAATLSIFLLLATGAGMMSWSAFAAKTEEESPKQVKAEEPDPGKGPLQASVEVKAVATDQERKDWQKFIDEEIQIEKLQDEIEFLRDDIRSWRSAILREREKPEPPDEKSREVAMQRRDKLMVHYEKGRKGFEHLARDLLETKRLHEEHLPRYGRLRLNLSPGVGTDQRGPDTEIPPAVEKRLAEIERKLDILIDSASKR